MDSRTRAMSLNLSSHRHEFSFPIGRMEFVQNWGVRADHHGLVYRLFQNHHFSLRVELQSCETDSEKRKLFWSIFQEMIIFYWESKVLVWQPAEELTAAQHGYRERIVQWVVSVSEIPPFHCSPFSNWWSWTRHSRIQNSNVRIQDHQNYERRSMKRRNLPYPRQLSC